MSHRDAAKLIEFIKLAQATERLVNQSSVMAINISLQHRNGHGQIVDVDAATLKLISATCGHQLAVNFMDARQQIIIRHMLEWVWWATFQRQQAFIDYSHGRPDLSAHA